MDNNLLTALIAAGSACLGALIPSLFSYLGKRKEFKDNRTAKLDEIRRDAFKEYLIALQTMMNDSNRDNFLPLQASTNKLYLFASSNLSSIVNRFFADLIQRSNQGNPLTEKEQTQYRTDIINAMRKDMGVSGKKLESVNMFKA